jgi:hypothetical protein
MRVVNYSYCQITSGQLCGAISPWRRPPAGWYSLACCLRSAVLARTTESRSECKWGERLQPAASGWCLVQCDFATCLFAGTTGSHPKRRRLGSRSRCGTACNTYFCVCAGNCPGTAELYCLLGVDRIDHGTN